MKTMCPPAYHRNRLWQIKFMHLGTWCMVTHCWYQSTKECSTSQARSINIISHERSWHRALKSHKSKMGTIYVQSWKQCALPVITATAFWHLAFVRFEQSVCHGSFVTNYINAPCLACWALFRLLSPAMCNHILCAQVVHELPQSRCGDNREGTVFSWLHIYCAHFTFVRFECAMDHLRLIIDR